MTQREKTGMRLARGHLCAARKIARLIAADTCLAGAAQGCREFLARARTLEKDGWEAPR